METFCWCCEHMSVSNYISACVEEVYNTLCVLYNLEMDCPK